MKKTVKICLGVIMTLAWAGFLCSCAKSPSVSELPTQEPSASSVSAPTATPTSTPAATATPAPTAPAATASPVSTKTPQPTSAAINEQPTPTEIPTPIDEPAPTSDYLSGYVSQVGDGWFTISKIQIEHSSGGVGDASAGGAAAAGESTQASHISLQEQTTFTLSKVDATTNTSTSQPSSAEALSSGQIVHINGSWNGSQFEAATVEIVLIQ